MKCEKCVHYKLCRDLFCHVEATKCEYYKPEPPTVERPRGKWLISPDKTRACCPFCHNKWTDAKEIALLNTVFRAKNFCEYCGADMRPKEGDAE